MADRQTEQKHRPANHPESLIPTGWSSAAARDFDAHQPIPRGDGRLLMNDTPMGDRGVEYVEGEPDLPGDWKMDRNSGSNVEPTERGKSGGG